jgi:hypothetical protein
MNKKLEAIAMKVVNKMNMSQPKHISLSEKNSGSIILVLMIIGIILSLVRIIQECNKKKLSGLSLNKKALIMKKSIGEICIKNNLINSFRLNRIIKNKLSPEDYKLYGAELKRAIMEAGPELTEDETITLVEESHV